MMEIPLKRIGMLGFARYYSDPADTVFEVAGSRRHLKNIH